MIGMVLTGAVVVLICAATLASVIWLWRWVTDDSFQVRAAHTERLATIEAQTRALVALAAQPSPHTYSPRITTTYSPHHTPLPGARLHNMEDAEPLASAAAAPTLPEATSLSELAFVPSVERILLGFNAQQQPITVSARQLCHVALVGATGGGKSNLLRLILPQIIAIGGRVVLADPHHAPFDPESGEDWRPIVRRLHLAPAVQATAIDALLDWATEELDRRLERRRNGERTGLATFVAYDELPIIIDSVPHAMERITRLVREGRKVGVYVIGASQSMLVKAVGGDSSAREAYRTAFYVGGDLRSAAAMLDMPQREIAEGQLRAGFAYLRAASSAPAQLVGVPHADNLGVQRLLGDGSEDLVDFQPNANAPATTPITMPLGNPSEPMVEVIAKTLGSEKIMTPEAARIIELFRNGRDIPEVVRTIWPEAQNGRRYQDRSAEVQSVLRTILQ